MVPGPFVKQLIFNNLPITLAHPGSLNKKNLKGLDFHIFSGL